MKNFMTVLVTVLGTGMIGPTGASALACHGGGGYGGYSSHYYPQYVREEFVREPVFAPTFSPAHSIIVVVPGDSWSSICSREYGNPSVWRKIAEFNGIPRSMRLTAGMQLRLPIVSPNGSMNLSSAPAAIPMQPQGFAGRLPQGMPQGGQFGQQGGIQQMNGFGAQGQVLGAQQLPPGMQQGSQVGPQGLTGLPQGQNGFPQGAQFGQQPSMGLPQGAQLGPQGPMNVPQGPQAGQQLQPGQPIGSQPPIKSEAPEGDSKDGGTVAQRILGELTGLPSQASGQPSAPNAPNAAPGNRPLPSIVIGSIMGINGQQLGDSRGTVRLIVHGSPVALEILEWSTSAAKVRIPADLSAGTQAQIEILRADGSVVAKDPVQLAAGQAVAATN